MQRIVFTAIIALMLGGCAHWRQGHAGHDAHDAAHCQGNGKEGEMCPLPNKQDANNGKDCCKGKSAPAASSN